MWKWIDSHGGYWTFGIFLTGLLVLIGTVGIWGLGAQEKAHGERIDKVAATAASELKRVESKSDSEDRRIESQTRANRELIEQINDRAGRIEAKLDRMDEKLDKLLMRVSAPPN